jgi:SAM-dependent methyltransferase
VEYAFLVLPAFNRVYGASAVRLSTSELGVLGERAMDGRLTEIAETTIAGLPYITFSAPALAGEDLALLANLSSIYALYLREGELLRPVAVRPLDRYSSDLVTILKYPGKTNEHFTKLLLNVTLLSMSAPRALLSRRLAVLDPMCGRGTTLNQALLYGCDVAGVEIDGKDFDAYSEFIRTWLKNKRFKHEAAVTSLARGGESLGRRLDVSFAATKELWRSAEVTRVTLINADTAKARAFLRAGSFDAVVTDLPYGVQHGSHDVAGLSRRPVDLLREAVPVWKELLRPGGALGISWNTHVAGRELLVEALAAHGLEVMSSAPFLDLRHRVDQAIVRDLVVARR